jgi:hypothetical protein
MGPLPAQESCTTNIVSAFDCDLVIPALNEEARLGDTIASLHEATMAASLKVQYIVVDNGCVDATADIVETVRRLDVPIESMSCQTQGKGSAVRAGIRHSTARFVGYCDADRSTPTSSVEHSVAQRPWWSTPVAVEPTVLLEFSGGTGALTDDHGVSDVSITST